MTPEQAREIDRLEFEAECAAIRQRAYALLRRPIKQNEQTRRVAQTQRRSPAAARPRRPRGRPARTLTVMGETLPMPAWAARLGISNMALGARLRKGWSIEDAVTVPKGRQPCRGVVSNFDASEGTGAGSTLRETPNITFHDGANS